MAKSKNKRELGPREKHPYAEYLAEGTQRMIVGSFPIGKFTNPDRSNEINNETEINFFYGGSKNKLWEIIGKCYNTPMDSIECIKKILTTKRIGVGDVILSCRRVNGSALDKDLKEIEWNVKLLSVLKNNNIGELIFTSKTVKKWFEKHISLLNDFKNTTLISPSGAALISVSASPAYKQWKKLNPKKRPKDYRLDMYKRIFL